MPIHFKTLFLLTHETTWVFEIKRLDIQSQEPSELYYWFVLDKSMMELKRLTFVSMSQESEWNRRVFEEASLKFNQEIGVLTHKNQEALTLQVNLDKQLTTAIEQLVIRFLRPQNYEEN